MNPTYRRDLLLTDSNGALVVTDPTTQVTHSLGPVAAAVFRAADGTRDVDALARVVATVDATLDRAAVWGVLDRLTAAGLMESAAAPVAAPVVDRRAWMRRALAAGAAAATATFASAPAQAAGKQGEAERKACGATADGRRLEEDVKARRAAAQQYGMVREADKKKQTDKGEEARRKRMLEVADPRRAGAMKRSMEQSRKRADLYLEVGGAAPGWLDLGSASPVAVALLADGSVLPGTGEVTTVALRAEWDAFDATPQEGLKAFAYDLERVARMVAASAKAAQPVTLALGPNAQLFGDLEVVGGAIDRTGTDATGATTSARIVLQVRLAKGALPLLPAASEVAECVETIGVGGWSWGGRDPEDISSVVP